MPTANITLTITTPNEMTIAEAMRLYSDAFKYQTQIKNASGQIIPNPESRQAFTKRMIAMQVRGAILQQERFEKAHALTSSNVTVE